MSTEALVSSFADSQGMEKSWKLSFNFLLLFYRCVLSSAFGRCLLRLRRPLRLPFFELWASNGMSEEFFTLFSVSLVEGTSSGSCETATFVAPIMVSMG